MKNLINFNNNQLIFIILILIPLIILLLCSYKKNSYEHFNSPKKKINEKFIDGLLDKIGLNETEIEQKKIKNDIPIINLKDNDKKDEKVNQPDKLKSYDDIKNNIPTKDKDIKNFNKDIPLLNNTRELKVANHGEKTDFDLKSRKCQFYDTKCPNGFTSLGSFSLLGESTLLCGDNNKKTKSAKAVASITNGMVNDIMMTDNGIGYKEVPKVIIVGDCNKNAEGECIVDDNGSIVGIKITNKGSGYIDTPIIKIDEPGVSQCHMCCEF